MMRSAGVFILAFVASAVAGMLAFAAVSWLPDWDDAAGRGLGEAFRLVLIAGYVTLSPILFAFAAWRRDRARHLTRALRILFLVPFLIAVLGAIDNGIRHIDWLRESIGMVQISVPLWIVALVQWLILHTYLTRQTADARTISASPNIA